MTLCREIKNCENFVRTDFRKIHENLDPRKFPAIRYVYNEKRYVGGLNTSLFCAIIPTLFPYFLPFWYPYILLHFEMFFTRRMPRIGRAKLVTCTCQDFQFRRTVSGVVYGQCPRSCKIYHCAKSQLNSLVGSLRSQLLVYVHFFLQQQVWCC